VRAAAASLRSLLVQVDGSARCPQRLAVAAELSHRFDARLEALFAVTPPLLDLAYSYAAESLPLQLLQDLYLGWRDRALAHFEAARLDRACWAELPPSAPLLPAFVEQARFADLMVLGQHDPGDLEREVPADFVPSVIVDSGRPALVLPYAGRFDTFGRHALVAWKPSGASLRALVGALPLLRSAERVTVLEWGSAPVDRREGALDIDGYLQLHGVQATLERQSDAPAEVGELLLSRAADLGADLLVMGCYGHSRAREFVLGGATRTVLASMTLPVLMAH
jgi:nucleotide-binding universal stress UspA family protein